MRAWVLPPLEGEGPFFMLGNPAPKGLGHLLCRDHASPFSCAVALPPVSWSGSLVTRGERDDGE